ncbi:MAG: hypothetical protein R2827_11015 [Bdellovibrionales bacterium]
MLFHEPKQKPLNDILHAIRTNLTLDEAQAQFFPNSERYLHGLQQLDKLYAPLPDFAGALRRSKELYESCCFSLNELKYEYPKEMIPDRHTAQSYLEQLTWEGARQRYGTLYPERLYKLSPTNWI